MSRTKLRFADADLIVLADGINSRFREKHQAHFQPEVDLRPINSPDGFDPGR